MYKVRAKEVEWHYFEFKIFNEQNFCINSFALKDDTIKNDPNLLSRLFETTFKDKNQIEKAMTYSNQYIEGKLNKDSFEQID